QAYSIQSQYFTLHSTTFITQSSIEKTCTEQAPALDVPRGVNAKIFRPSGRQLT
ncbi:hypothetical protein DER46DRAFT_515102, partial [Fusarium sp. MPI-SDFR-AT-0072]